jgi:hypothetical protein
MNELKAKSPMNNDIQQKQPLPNATTVLVLGICSIVTTCMLVGLILGIIGLVIGNKSRKLYNENPDMYEGYSSLNAGYIMSIIGTAIGGFAWLYFITYFVIVGSVLATAFGAAAAAQ